MANHTAAARDQPDSTGTPETSARDIQANRLRLIAANALQNAGDQVVKASTVLTWLLVSLGAPAAMIGLLVPIRESGSMLPQAALTPWVRRQRQRKWVWVAGAAGQAAAVAVMAFAAATMRGTTAGTVILIALAAFALSRALTSIASKDVQGRTIPKGQRGDINGISALASGVVAVTIGLGIRFWGGSDTNTRVIAMLLAAAAVTWVVALAVFSSIDEPVEEGGKVEDSGNWLSGSVHLLRNDVPFRKFVMVRALLLVSALSPPFIVNLAAQQVGAGLSGLGPFVIASGLAAIIGGKPFGLLADWSSRNLMIWGAAAASAIIAGMLVLAELPGVGESGWLFLAAYFLLTLTHTGVRVARKTYVVDMASGDQRTQYVAVANTTMGVLLLVTGAVSSGLAQIGTGVALGFLAALGLLGVVVGQSLPEVSKDEE